MDIHSFAAPVIFILNNTPLTTSKAIADYFHQPHPKILRAINHLASHCPDEWWRQHFKVADQTQSTVYHITRDGFAVLSSRFKHPQTAALKIAYLHTFNQANREIPIDHKPLSRQQQLHLYSSIHILSQSSHKPIHCFIEDLKVSFGIHDFSEVNSDNYVAVCGLLGILPVYAVRPQVEMSTKFYHYPKDSAKPFNTIFPNQSWLTAAELLTHSPQPVRQLLTELKRDGHEVEGCVLEWKATQMALEQLVECVNDVAKNCERYLNRGMQVVWG